MAEDAARSHNSVEMMGEGSGAVGSNACRRHGGAVDNPQFKPQARCYTKLRPIYT